MDQKEIIQRIVEINEQSAMEFHIEDVHKHVYWIMQMVHAGLAEVDNGAYVTVRLTPHGRECVTACKALAPLYAEDPEGQQYPPSDLLEDKPTCVSVGAQVLLYLDGADPCERWEIQDAVSGDGLGDAIDLLVERGLITFDHEDAVYAITGKGHNWLLGK